MAEELTRRWHCASCTRPLPGASSICPACDVRLTPVAPRVEDAGPYACPACGLHFRASASVLTPQNVPWYVPQNFKPVCPHCQTLLADRRESWALLPLMLLLFLLLVSFLRPGAGGLAGLIGVVFNWSTERRWRNRPDRYAVPTQVLESAGFLPTDQPFTPRRRMQLLWQMGYWAAGLHLLLMVLLPPLGQLAPWQIDMPQSAGWLLVAWLPAGLGWVLPRSRFKAAAQGTLALWAVTGVYACTQGQATLGLSLLVWAAYVALVTRKLR